jgi:hypothetical protein
MKLITTGVATSMVYIALSGLWLLSPERATSSNEVVKPFDETLTKRSYYLLPKTNIF